MHEAGCWADRLSANVELPTQEDLTKLAPEKQLVTIRQTMSGITSDVERAKEELRAASKIVSTAGCLRRREFRRGDRNLRRRGRARRWSWARRIQMTRRF